MSAPITLVGRIGDDPKVTFAANGNAVTRLRVVTSGRRLVNEKWEDVDVTWWTVVMFGKLAETVVECVSKGDSVIVTGKVRGVEWETDGVKKHGTEVVADAVGVNLRWGSPNRIQRSTTADDMFNSGLAEGAPF